MSERARIHLQVMWNRILAVVEEQAQTLIRTGFSTSTREAGDVSAGVFDLRGRMLAQAVTGTPGHINSMALSVRHFVKVFPVNEMHEGDCYITNDPWKGTGHLHDFVVVSPTFHNGRIIALFACTCHVVDIGGIGMSPDGRQIYHEGLMIPIMTFARNGEVNETLLDIVRGNVREPEQVVGDMFALAACNEAGGRRLLSLMQDVGIDDLEDLSRFIINNTRQAMTAAIGRLPRGKVSNMMTMDGYDEPITLCASLEVREDTIVVDYDGTSPVSRYGINCPKCYTDAYTAFGVKCVIAPNVPNNAGSLDAIVINAPEGSIVNAPHPCAVVARSTVGHMLPDVVFGCLHQLLPGQVPAEGTSCLWNLKLGSGPGITRERAQDKTTFMTMSFHSGGTGARPGIDGLNATPFPSGVRNVPAEVMETATPVIVWRKEFRTDSGGPGRQRGGLGQVIEVGSAEDAEFALFATYDRLKHPPRGREGGCDGSVGRVSLASGIALRGMGSQTVPAGDRLVVEMPGGGGYGAPTERSATAVRRDVMLGYVSAEVAGDVYGVIVDEKLEVDEVATTERRALLTASALQDDGPATAGPAAKGTCEMSMAASTRRRDTTANTLLLASGVQRMQPSASAVTAQRARTMMKSGIDVLNLAAGEPDFDTPAAIVEAARRAVASGHTKYTNVDGTAELKEAVIEKFDRDNGLRFETDEVIVTSGAKQAIFNALAATLQPDDEVVVPVPCWVSYPEIVRFFGAKPVFVPCLPEDGFKLRPDALSAAISPKTRWLMLNTPCNPTGAVYAADDLRALADCLREHSHVWIMSDEIYEHVLLGDATFTSFGSVADDLLRARTLTVNGVSKAYCMTGWRIGYAAGPAKLIKAMSKMQSQSTGNSCSISQAAAVAALTGDQADIRIRNAAYTERRDQVIDKLNAIPGITCSRPDGAFYIFASCASAIGRTTSKGAKLLNDKDVADYLLDDAKVAVVCGEAYGLSPYFRLSIASDLTTLETACDRIGESWTRLQ